MKILSLDLSINCPGWCVADDDVYIASGYREHKVKGLSVYERIEANLELARGLVRDYGIGVIWMEDIADSPHRMFNRATAIMLCEQAGIFKYWFRYRRLPVYTFSISDIKKSVSGVGNADKGLMLSAVRARGFPQVSQNDEVDAIAIWLCGLGKDISFVVN